MLQNGGKLGIKYWNFTILQTNMQGSHHFATACTSMRKQGSNHFFIMKINLEIWNCQPKPQKWGRGIYYGFDSFSLQFPRLTSTPQRMPIGSTSTSTTSLSYTLTGERWWCIGCLTRRLWMQLIMRCRDMNKMQAKLSLTKWIFSKIFIQVEK